MIVCLVATVRSGHWLPVSALSPTSPRHRKNLEFGVLAELVCSSCKEGREVSAGVALFDMV